MATDRTGSKYPRRGLSCEDAKLWERVARSAEPLKSRSAPTSPSQPPARELKQEDRTSQASKAQPHPKPDRQAAERPRVPPLARFDTREARRLAGGRLTIDAQVDLHGLTQRQAYARLKGFLLSAQAQGHRRVLVITGKGLTRSQDEPESFWKARDHGVLKRLVPQWLSEPDFRALVVGFTTAQRRHGGEGALYVQIGRAHV